VNSTIKTLLNPSLTGGCSQDPVVDRLVAVGGRVARDRPRPHHLRRLQRNDPRDERLTIHRCIGRRDRDDLVTHLLVYRHVGGGINIPPCLPPSLLPVTHPPPLPPSIPPRSCLSELKGKRNDKHVVALIE
jgi:hypothetical protein